MVREGALEDVMTNGESSASVASLPRPSVLHRDASQSQGDNTSRRFRKAALIAAGNHPLSLVLFVPFVDARREAPLFLTHMSLFAQVMLHRPSRSRNNGDRLG